MKPYLSLKFFTCAMYDVIILPTEKYELSVIPFLGSTAHLVNST